MRIATRRKSQTRSRLGDLFLEACIISPKMLAEGLRIAGGSALPLGRVLIMAGFVSENEVKAAIELQLMVRNAELSHELAVKALRLCHCKRVEVDKALELVGVRKDDVLPLGQLGVLLLKAEIVHKDHLQHAVRNSRATGDSVGRILVMRGLISPLVLSVALNILVLVRDGKVPLRMGALILRKTYVDRISLDEALRSFEVDCSRQQPVKLGSILSAAGCLPESDTVFAVEIGLEYCVQIGWVLIESGLVSEYVIEAAVQLQSMVNSAVLPFRKAVEVLRLVEDSRVSVDTVLSEYDSLALIS